MDSAATLTQIREILRRYTDRLRDEMAVHAVYLFGSYATGSASEVSDIDVAVISPDFSGIRFHDNVRLAKIGRSIDDRIEPWGFRPEEFNEEHVLPTVVLETGIKVFPEAS